KNCFNRVSLSNARKAYQELLLTKLKRQEKRKIILELAHSWERDNNAQKAIATAWTAIPPDGKSTDANETQIIVNLVIRNAKKLNSQPDIENATEILKTLSSN
ncbi:MAG: hypothetical protein PHE87_04940, partial [Victivallaceae bacterium]|nr:hypothetical protein [Victivallaceae bacterium]